MSEIKVGDRVTCGGIPVDPTVIAINGVSAWCRFDDGIYRTFRLDELAVVPTSTPATGEVAEPGQIEAGK